MLRHPADFLFALNYVGWQLEVGIVRAGLDLPSSMEQYRRLSQGEEARLFSSFDRDGKERARGYRGRVKLLIENQAESPGAFYFHVFTMGAHTTKIHFKACMFRASSLFDCPT